MRGVQWRAAAAVPLVVGLLAGCGGASKAAPKVTAGKVVSGESETGMKLKVETFVPPATDPTLKQLDAYRAAGKYPPVDFHRVTADNTKGAVADRIRTVSFATSVTAIASGRGVESRFACDALQYEWPPKDGVASSKETYAALRKVVCAVPPTAADGIAPGKRIVYYLITDRGFDTRGIRSQNVFGPRDTQFK
jgi:hypothetical protein